MGSSPYAKYTLCTRYNISPFSDAGGRTLCMLRVKIYICVTLWRQMDGNQCQQSRSGVFAYRGWRRNGCFCWERLNGYIPTRISFALQSEERQGWRISSCPLCCFRHLCEPSFSLDSHRHLHGGGELDRRDVLDLIHGRSRMNIDPRIPTMPRRSISGSR